MSFIETSALDASKVEMAFQNILTGMDPSDLQSNSIRSNICTEIYHIVSSKVLNDDSHAQSVIGGPTINVGVSDSDVNNGKRNNCC